MEVRGRINSTFTLDSNFAKPEAFSISFASSIIRNLGDPERRFDAPGIPKSPHTTAITSANKWSGLPHRIQTIRMRLFSIFPANSARFESYALLVVIPQLFADERPKCPSNMRSIVINAVTQIPAATTLERAQTVHLDRYPTGVRRRKVAMEIPCCVVVLFVRPLAPRQTSLHCFDEPKLQARSTPPPRRRANSSMTSGPRIRSLVCLSFYGGNGRQQQHDRSGRQCDSTAFTPRVSCARAQSSRCCPPQSGHQTRKGAAVLGLQSKHGIAIGYF